MTDTQMKVEEKENEEERKEYSLDRYAHPFWSLFNDYFGGEATTDVMKTDISATNDGYELEVEVPGVDKKDIRLSIDKGYLSISAKVERKETHGKNLRVERYRGSFSRSFYVGDNIKKEDISASCNNGILTILIKKPAEVKQEEKFIEIQ